MLFGQMYDKIENISFNFECGGDQKYDTSTKFIL